MALLKSDSAGLKAPLVSVVITCYNYGKYLAGCIESVLGQTFKDYDIIIVNDGSTDETDAVAEMFLHHEKIHYIKQRNAGQANSKNTGIENSRGKYLAFLDADDVWEQSKLEKQIPLFSDPQVGVVYSKARYIEEHVAELDFELSGEYLKPRSGNVTQYLFFDNFVPFSSSVVRRECLQEFGGFDESLKMGIDWDLWLRCSTKYKFDYIDETLLVYRLGHPGQMSKNTRERQRCSDHIMDRFLKIFPGVIPSSVQKASLAYTYCNRGYYLRDIDRKRSNWMYVRAMEKNPLARDAYRGLLRNIAFSILRRTSHSGNEIHHA
jgi:glycosyltransferase involved in cell wall biosynthesis